MAKDRLLDDEVLEKPFNRETFVRITGYLRPYLKSIALILSLIGITSAIGLLNPYLMKLSIDNYISKGNLKGLMVLVLIFLGLNGISLLCSRYRISLMSKVAKNILYQIRQDLFSHLQDLSIDFFESRPVGKILSRVIGDVNSLNDVIINTITSIVPDSITLLAIIIILVKLHPQLAMVGLIILPFLAISLFCIQVISRKRWQQVRKKFSTANAYIHETFAGAKVVKAFVQEKATGGTFLDLLKDIRRVWLSAIRVNAALWPVVDASWGISMALVYWYGIRLLNTGGITIGLLVAFTGYIGMLWQPILNLSNFYNSLISAMAGAERIFEIMDIKPAIVEKPDAVDIGEIKGEVEFKNVTFCYDNERPVLNGVNFKVRPGETIALVGPTGAGKTTIINLIARFYDVTDGAVLIDGRDIRDIKLKSLRSKMGIMLQDTFLFNGTIADNIRYGKPDATMDEIIKAAKTVGAHDFIIQTEKGYDTEILEMGNRLSTGQRQLIALARTIIADPHILILDEATSSIDTHTEVILQKALEKVMENRTSFVIAHRLSTIRNADRIFVVDGGRIIEMGSHSELINRKGLYYDLYRSQYEAMEKIS
ncbi:ABC transporter ATP-binding protein [Caldanaerobius polysaccharolyticus]|uniref:ABC transporter ATP-binding protein n=1 Tax=Caldanaerobius polysaccharolyticus TaxID=44256 RepID=UPI00047DABB2|nr:ABC transporter ATP-binding protein [Caldanaerobius polysaccharolyticus]